MSATKKSSKRSPQDDWLLELGVALESLDAPPPDDAPDDTYSENGSAAEDEAARVASEVGTPRRGGATQASSGPETDLDSDDVSSSDEDDSDDDSDSVAAEEAGRVASKVGARAASGTGKSSSGSRTSSDGRAGSTSAGSDADDDYDAADEGTQGTPTLVIDGFATGKWAIPPRHMDALKALKADLVANENKTVILLGNTDTVGSQKENMKLGMERAGEVSQFLVAGDGIKPSRIKLASKGEKKPAAGEPKAKTDPDPGQDDPKNRRVEVFVSGTSSPAAKATDSGSGEASGEATSSGPTSKTGEGKDSGTDKGVAPDKRTPQEKTLVPTPPPKGPKGPTSPPAGPRLGLAFSLDWESEEFGKWGKDKYLRGGFKLKATAKGELDQVGTGKLVTVGGSVGSASPKGDIELAKQKAIDVFNVLQISEAKETLNYTFSLGKVELSLVIKITFETGYSWCAPLVTGKFIVASVDWEKLKKDPDSLTVGGLELGAGSKFQTNDLKVGSKLTAKLSGEFVVTGTVKLNWEKILLEIAKEYGLDAAVTAAAGESAAAGGGGVAAAVAVAAAPAAGIVGGIVGGIALTIGVMKAIDVLAASGRDASDMCTEAATRLRAYARSYGSTMRGSPGDVPEGNQDAEARLQAMMKASPGMTHEQAVDAAKQSKVNFENMAYRALLPTMRQKVKEAYDKAHPWIPDNVFNTVRDEILDENGHY